jgi:hypothetical protein
MKAADCQISLKNNNPEPNLLKKSVKEHAIENCDIE